MHKTLLVIVTIISLSGLLPPQSVAQTDTSKHCFPLSVVDPTPESNPAGAFFPGIRGGNQLIQYTPKFGQFTETNEYGTEITIIDKIVVNKNGSNSLIPEDGYILSGHGIAKKWLNKNTIIGTRVQINNTGMVTVTTTPESYLYRTKRMIQTAKDSIEKAYEQGLNVPVKYATAYLQKARADYTQAEATKEDISTSKLIELTNSAYKAAEIAYYKSLPAVDTSFSGIWIRPKAIEKEKISEIVIKLKETGINNIYLESFFHGYTIYPSQVAKKFGLENQNPIFKGSDPLQDWVTIAHKNGLKVHIWFETFYAGTGNSGPILSKNPEWANVQKKYVNSKVLKPSYIEPNAFFLDPANPEARYYIRSIIAEMCKHYDIDGINLDYIRYPNSLPDNFPNYLNSTWGYTKIARKEFKKEFGKDPVKLNTKSKLWPQWVSYRQRKVSLMVREAFEEIKGINKNIVLSAVTFPNQKKAASQKLQNWSDWVSCGYIDNLTPIILGSSPELISNYCFSLEKISQGKVGIIPGIFGAFNNDLPVNFVQQVISTNKKGIKGVNIFDYAHLKPEYAEALKEGPFKPKQQYR